MNAAELIAFEDEVARRFTAGEIPGPVHLNSPSQAEPLIEIFKEIHHGDWVLSTWRSHWHALLKGIPRELVMAEILAGRSMMLHFPAYKFMTSAIMGGMLPLACGLAAYGQTVWCFVGDMCASTGAYKDARRYIGWRQLPVHLVVEDNKLSTNTPTLDTWGPCRGLADERIYEYKRTVPHYGAGTYAPF